MDPSTESKPSGLVREIALLVRHRRAFVATVACLTAAAIVYSLVAQKRFEAHTTVLPAGDESAAGFGGLAALLSSVPLQGANLPGVSTTTDLLAGLLRSRRLLQPIVEEFDLVARYDADTMDEALYTLDEQLVTGVGDEGILHVRFRDRDPEFAATLLNALIDALDAYNVMVATTNGRRHREFLESRVAETLNALRRSEDALTEYQKTNAIPIGPEQMASAESVGGLIARKLTLQIELDALSQFLNRESPPIVQRRAELEALDREIGSLPAIGIEAVRLYRDLKVQEQLYLLLSAQLEQARIDENRDLPRVQVIDRAIPPELRYWPKRKLIVVSAFALSLALGVLLVHLLDFLERERETLRKLVDS